MSQKSASVTAKEKQQNGFFHFVGQVKSELKRITWTGKEELKLYTKIVVSATFALGMAIYASDLFIQSALSVLNTLFKVVFG